MDSQEYLQGPRLRLLGIELMSPFTGPVHLVTGPQPVHLVKGPQPVGHYALTALSKSYFFGRACNPLPFLNITIIDHHTMDAVKTPNKTCMIGPLGAKVYKPKDPPLLPSSSFTFYILCATRKPLYPFISQFRESSFSNPSSFLTYS